MITAHSLVKRYGDKVAVDDLSFTAHPGSITGFLGPNGAGKSTTMRMIMGLETPTSGTVTVNGKPLARHARPLHEVGALLDARAVHPGRSARNHLLAQAAAAGISTSCVDDVIDMVGLRDVATERAGTFSLGMGQRLGLASAILADPQTLVLDEPINGLDADGVRWIRDLLKDFAYRGRTVLLSSHLMSEVAVTADRVIVVARGRLLRDQAMADFIAQASSNSVMVRSPQALEFSQLLAGPEVTIRSLDYDRFIAEGLGAEEIGAAAAQAGIALYDLTPQEASLEDAYMALIGATGDYPSHTTPECTSSPDRSAA